jgi:4-oxalocrotonate tautomerase
MPHVVVKLAPGNTEEQKNRFAEKIVQDMIDLLGKKEENISVALEEVDPRDWVQKVYTPEIQGKWETLYKKPGYNPFEK